MFKETTRAPSAGPISGCARALLVLATVIIILAVRGNAQNQCLALDGVGDHMDVANAPDLTIAGATTIELWIRLPAYPSYPAEIVNKKDRVGGTFKGFTLHLQSGFLTLAFWEVGNTIGYFVPQVLIPWTLIPLGTWTHVAGVFDGTTIALLIDGSIQGATGFPFAYAPSVASSLRLGWDAEAPSYNPNTFLQGELDEVRYWNVARTQTEIVTSMNLEFDSIPGLVACWHFNGSLADGSGGHTGTLGGNASLVASTAPVAPQGSIGPCAGGNVGIGLGGPFDLLTINGSAGLPARRVDVGIGLPITIAVAQPPTNPLASSFALIGFIGVPTPADAYTLPFGIGTLCFPAPQLNPSYPGLFTLTNNFGPEPGQLVGSNPAPWSFTAAGLPFAFQFTLQGVIQQDPGTVRVMNGVIVNVQ